MKFDLLTDGQEIKFAVLMKLTFLAIIFFAFITFGDGFFQFQVNN